VKNLLIRLLVVSLILKTLPAFAQIPGMEPENALSVGGYIKYLANINIPKEGETFTDHIIHQRFNIEYRHPLDLRFKVGMRNQLIYGDTVKVPGYSDLIENDIGYWDFSWNWLNNDKVLGNTALDRLYADWTPGEWNARFGRQRVYWAMSHLWNPNDIFNSYSIFDFDYEERRGTDSFLIGRDLGFASRLELVWAFGDDWDQTSLAGRYQFNTHGYDIHFLGGKSHLDLVGGAGFAGSIYGAGFRGELSYFDAYKTEQNVNESSPHNSSTVATLELDYSFNSARNFTVKGDLLYISNPEDPGSALVYLNQPLTARTLSFTKWTFYADVSFDITPLSRQSFALNGYDDGSWFGMASNSISLADDWELFLIWQHFGGDSDSLFGINPADLLFARIRWSF